LLKNLKPLGCPAYELDPRTHGGKKITKWDPKSKCRQFLGMSKQHASTIGLICNLTTGSVTLQYHIVYNELFTTVTSRAEFDEQQPANWIDLLTYSRDYAQDDVEWAAMGHAGKERVKQYFSKPCLLTEWQHLLEGTCMVHNDESNKKKRKAWSPKTHLYLFEAVMSLLLYWLISQVLYLVWFLILWCTTTTTSSNYLGDGSAGHGANQYTSLFICHHFCALLFLLACCKLTRITQE